MMASRLVKSCLFMLVALAPVAAKAGFIIDTFNSSAPNYSLANTLNVSRSIAVSPNASGVFTGTSFAVSLTGAPPAFGSGGAIFDYSFSNGPIGLKDALGGPNSGLNLRFNTVTGSGWIVTATWFSDNFATIIGSNSANLTGAGSLNIGAANLNGANSLRIAVLNSVASSGSFDLTTVTATPEPTTLVLFGSVAGMGLVARRRFKKKLV